MRMRSSVARAEREGYISLLGRSIDRKTACDWAGPACRILMRSLLLSIQSCWYCNVLYCRVLATVHVRTVTLTAAGLEMPAAFEGSPLVSNFPRLLLRYSSVYMHSPPLVSINSTTHHPQFTTPITTDSTKICLQSPDLNSLKKDGWKGKRAHYI